jgi:ABC-type glycerol-3-phosphate transport system substrate-binding protein
VLLLLSGCGSTDAVLDEPIQLTLGTYNGSYLSIVEEFNSTQSDYYIEIIDYSDGGTISREQAIKRLNAELATGDGPDLLYLWSLQMDVDIYGPKGYLENLLPYLEQDAELSVDDIVPSFLNTYAIDGALYGAAPGFSIISMYGPESVLSQFETWDFNALEQLGEACGGAQNLFSTEQSSLEFLQSSLMVALSDFVDFQSGTASFDSQEFADVLEFCAALDAPADETEQPLLTYYVMNSFMELQYYEALYGDKIAFVGYPSETNSGNCFVNIMDQYGMRSNSEHKEGAWQFLRMLYSEEYQYEKCVSGGNICFPTNQAAMERLIERSESTLTQLDADGQEVEITARGNQADFTYHAATQEQVAQIMTVIENTDMISYMTSDILNIVVEEAGYYFDGLKDVAETQAIIQQRVALFLSERQ